MMWIAEHVFMNSALQVFLIKGHAKNISNRHWNFIKTTYHMNDIYNKEQMDAVLSQSDFVLVFVEWHKDEPSKADWDKWVYIKS